MSIQDNQAAPVNHFHTLTDMVRERFRKIRKGYRLVRVKTEGLHAAYLAGLSDDLKQKSNCSCCKKFIEAYGNLAYIDAHGFLVSVLWHEYDAPEPYKRAVNAMATLVQEGVVECVFYSIEPYWGTPDKGQWRHFNLKPSLDLVHTGRQSGASFLQKLSQERFNALSDDIERYDLDLVKSVIDLIDTPSPYQDAKMRASVRFLHNTHLAIKGLAGVQRDNLIWRIVADIPKESDLCKPIHGQLASILDELKAGVTVEQLIARAVEKRQGMLAFKQANSPDADPADARALLAKMGIEPALHRRLARLDEIQTIWRASSVQPHQATTSSLMHNISFSDFQSRVLPKAQKIEMIIGDNPCLRVFTTAVNPDSPAILEWDDEVKRNPFSTYIWSEKTSRRSAQDWNLSPGSVEEVVAIALNPAHWNDMRDTRFEKTATFVLKNAREGGNPHLSIFPSNLKKSLVPVMQAIETCSTSRAMDGVSTGDAIGYCISEHGEYSNRFRVTTDSGMAEYCINIWG